MLTGGLTSLLTGSFGFQQLFNKTFTSRLVKLLAGFFRLIKLLSPKRLISYLRGLVDRKVEIEQQRWTVKDFSCDNFETIDPTELIDEERNINYTPEDFYPVRIGQVLASRYQVVGKLGYGATSTVWLARDLQGCRYVVLKVYVHTASMGCGGLPELAAYKRLQKGPKDHPGRQLIRGLLGAFVIKGPHGKHHCLVHQPLWNSIYNWRREDLMTPDHFAKVFVCLCLALDYLKECELIHTDITENDIMFTLEDNTILERYENRELEFPTARKEVDGRIIYRARMLGRPKDMSGLGLPVLCDFGAAVWAGEPQHFSQVQRRCYRAPEVILGKPWSYEIDIWNLGCLLWFLFQGTYLFLGLDEFHTYRSRTHLVELMSCMGRPSPEFLEQCAYASDFFSPEGQFLTPSEILPPVSLDEIERTLEALEGEGPDRDLFIRLFHKMLRWDPVDRSTPKQLLNDEWLIARLAKLEEVPRLCTVN